ncbi:hypothetical protein [Fusobacterium polymorphum]|uniref:hypothetical protein n=1 Tax=Fusobacterium nucleatum subsp. polymorphum TaxID=76857 RepID=UPI0030D187DA
MSKLKNNEYLDFDDYFNDETKASKEEKIMKEKYIYPCVIYEEDGIFYANFKDFDLVLLMEKA